MYILVKETITISGARRDAATRLVDGRNKQVIFIKCESFCNYISEINNTKLDNAKEIDGMMPMYDLIKFSENYPKKIYRHLQHSCRDEPNNDITDYESFKSKTKIIRSAAAYGNTKDVEIAAPLEYEIFRGPLKCG